MIDFFIDKDSRTIVDNYDDSYCECVDSYEAKQYCEKLNAFCKENKQLTLRINTFTEGNKTLQARLKEMDVENKNIKAVLEDFMDILNKIQVNPTDEKLLNIARDMLQNMGVIE